MVKVISFIKLLVELFVLNNNPYEDPNFQHSTYQAQKEYVDAINNALSRYRKGGNNDN